MDDLRGVRLGRLERAILLRAGVEEFAAIDPADLGGPLQPALSRARSKLLRIGLLETKWISASVQPVERPRTVQRRNRYGGTDDYTVRGTGVHYRLTPLGARVVASFRTELETARQLRWDRLPTETQHAGLGAVVRGRNNADIVSIE